MSNSLDTIMLALSPCPSHSAKDSLHLGDFLYKSYVKVLHVTELKVYLKFIFQN